MPMVKLIYEKILDEIGLPKSEYYSYKHWEV